VKEKRTVRRIKKERKGKIYEGVGWYAQWERRERKRH
jgi:hypothetical protein